MVTICLDEQTNERVGRRRRTDRKHNSFVDTVGWQRYKMKTGMKIDSNTDNENDFV